MAKILCDHTESWQDSDNQPRRKICDRLAAFVVQLGERNYFRCEPHSRAWRDTRQSLTQELREE